MIEKQFSDDKFSLAKGLHHVNIAKQYFEDIKITSKGTIKNTFTGYVQKCDYIINDVYDRLSEKTRKFYKEEMSDSLGIDHITDQLMRLDVEQRQQIEDIINNVVKGKRVKIMIDEEGETQSSSQVQ